LSEKVLALVMDVMCHRLFLLEKVRSQYWCNKKNKLL